jgi:hypothetical protein
LVSHINLREKHRFRVSENGELRRLFLVLRGMKWQEAGKNSAERSCMNSALHQIKVKQSRYTPWRRLGGQEV